MVITADQYFAFRDLLQQKTGILLGENKQYLVSSRLSSFLKEQGIEDFASLISVLSRPTSAALLQQVIDRMTTNETLWFRDNFPFQYLFNTILPEFKSQGLNKASIWCAACSSGQEPYSIVMGVEETKSLRVNALPAMIDITATDISQKVLDQAKKGTYQSLEINRGLSEERRKRFFKESEGRYELNDQIRSKVRFSTLNLMQLPYRGFNQVDVIFCRNVLIYFSVELKVRVLKGMLDALRPGGYLFLGASESMPPEVGGFDMIRCNPGLVYRKK